MKLKEVCSYLAPNDPWSSPAPAANTASPQNQIVAPTATWDTSFSSANTNGVGGPAVTNGTAAPSIDDAFDQLSSRSTKADPPKEPEIPNSGKVHFSSLFV